MTLHIAYFMNHKGLVKSIKKNLCNDNKKPEVKLLFQMFSDSEIILI